MFATSICARRTITHQFIRQKQLRALNWADHQRNAEWLDNLTRLRNFIRDTGTHPHGMTLPWTAWVWLNRLCTGVRRAGLKGMGAGAIFSGGPFWRNSWRHRL